MRGHRGALEGGLGLRPVGLGGLVKGKGDHFDVVQRGQRLFGEAGAVHVVDVALELVFAFEGGAAVGAVKRTGVRVDHHVLRQRLLDPKGLVALGASVGFLTWHMNTSISVSVPKQLRSLFN